MNTNMKVDVVVSDIADSIIASYLEHYSLPLMPASGSHLHDCIMSNVDPIIASHGQLLKAIQDLLNFTSWESGRDVPSQVVAARNAVKKAPRHE